MALLYADGIQIGSATVNEFGAFVIASTKALKSGNHTLTVTVMNAQGAESKPKAAGNAVIPPPPTHTSKQIVGNTVTVQGKGIPNHKIKLYSDGVWVGSAVVAGDGTYRVSSVGLALGSHQLQVISNPTPKKTRATLFLLAPPRSSHLLPRNLSSPAMNTRVAKSKSREPASQERPSMFTSIVR